MSDFEARSDVKGFFIEHVASAMQDLRVETAEETRGYLVELLSGFVESQRIPALFIPLAEQLQGALHAHGPERRARLQVLGDIALFLSGFYPDSFDRRGLSEAYVLGMGGRAYRIVAQSSESRTGRVFEELAERFRELVRVLDEVRERTTLHTAGDVLRLYARFQRTGAPTLERRLRRRGVVLPPTGGLPN